MPTPVIPPDWPVECFLCARAIAARVERPEKVVTSWLSRLAERFPDSRVEVPNPRRRDAKYIYRVRDIWPLLLIWLADGET